jgi:hypothetical protein
MISIMIDDSIKRVLLAADDLVELCDEAGNSFGYFLSPKQSQDIWKVLVPELSEEEVRRRVETGEPGFSTQQVLKYLKMRAS